MGTVVNLDVNGDMTPKVYPDNFAGTGASLPAGTDRSGVTVVGTKEVAAANPSRQAMTFQNTSDTDMRLTESGAAAAANNGYLVRAGTAVNISTNKAVSVYCSVAGKTYASTEV